MKKTIAVIIGAVMLAVTAPVASAQLGRQQGLLDPNVAAEKDLAALPHMNATLAKGIVDQRPILNMTSLDSYLSKTLAKQQLAELYGKLFLHVNLNTASREELLLIPNLGTRMAHEFEEYRPYKSYAQFQREIGKYVDAKEVARLEQYTFIPINLNTATDPDILSIPGMGNRMLHEFKEYRPYKTMDQFRREIGKYVDAKEVSRFERYVVIQ
jgi:DNA uptake protein ComE-like DNA-binding protein